MTLLREKFPHILLTAYLVLFTALGIDPPSGREVWLAENLPICIIVLLLVILYRWFRFSNLGYFLMSFLIFMHTIGGYYTFAAVPFDWFTDFFGFERNHYDRIAHFTVGFYAFAIAEYLTRKALTNAKTVTYLFALFAIMALAGTYEVMEWQFAVLGNPEAGAEVLGSQGDIWDAQKDIVADTLGAVFALLLFHLVNGRRKIW
jgi:putative membrane protein